jgi:hypothetical protein
MQRPPLKVCWTLRGRNARYDAFMKMFTCSLLFASLVGNLGGSAIATETPKPVQGGANQINAVSGCANKWLFNGVWRFKVDSLESDDFYGSKEWKVTVELRNGTRATHELMDTGVNYTGNGVELFDADGNSSEVVGDDFYYHFSGKSLIQGQGVKYKLLFQKLGDGKPAKLVMPFDASLNKDKAHFSVKDPSFRVDLTCGLPA